MHELTDDQLRRVSGGQTPDTGFSGPQAPIGRGALAGEVPRRAGALEGESATPLGGRGGMTGEFGR